MGIDTSSNWWIGDSPHDIADFLKAYAEAGYPVDEFRLCRCNCGSDEFQLEASDDDGVARRICSKCASEHYICDSQEHWIEAVPERWMCLECNSEATNIGVGFSIRDGKQEIKWLYIGIRCVNCGILGCFAGWKINFWHSLHLLDQV